MDMSCDVKNVPSDICAQQRFRSACAFALSDKNIHGVFWITKDAKFRLADNEDPDQTDRICRLIDITKTCLYNFDPLQPHFYIVKLGFTGVYIIFLISAKKHKLWVLVRTASSRRF